MMAPGLLIYGAGSVGAFIGVLLAGEHDVIMLGRPQVLGFSGLGEFSLRRYDGQTCTENLRIAGSLSEIPPKWRPDGIIITTKAFAITEVAEDIKPLYDKWGQPWLCAFQNGIGAEETLCQSFDAADIISATLTASCSLGERHVVQNSRGGVALAALGRKRGRDCGQLAQSFARHQLLCRCLTEYKAMKWSKLILNQIANGICALTDKLPAEVIADAEMFGLEIECAREVIAVMDQMGVSRVDLPGYPVRLVSRLLRMLPVTVLQRTLGRKIARSRGDKLPSLLLDVRSGRQPREGKFMYGAVAEYGARLGVSTPVNTAVDRLLSEGRFPLTTDELVQAVGNAR